jgi:hypothetical protein
MEEDHRRPCADDVVHDLQTAAPQDGHETNLSGPTEAVRRCREEVTR